MIKRALVIATAAVVAAIGVLFAMGVGGSVRVTQATDYDVDMESGWMTVNKTNEIVRLDFQCQTALTETVNLEIFGVSGPAKVDVTKEIPAGGYAAITYDPTATGRFRARANDLGAVNHPWSFCRTSFELISTANGQEHLIAVLELHNIYEGA